MPDGDEQRFAGGARATGARLERLIGELRGVEAVEVDVREDGSPHVRVRLDGSATSEQVGDEIQRILATVDSVAEPTQQEPVRRAAELLRDRALRPAVPRGVLRHEVSRVPAPGPRGAGVALIPPASGSRI